jgi:hypothetical protein
MMKVAGIQPLFYDSEIVHVEVYRGIMFYVIHHKIMGCNHLCGYVAIPEIMSIKAVNENMASYDFIDCHGGITFSESAGSTWIIGFDCMHSCDIHNPKNIHFVIFECISIIDQLLEKLS